VDEKFDETSPLRDNNRLVTAAARIALGVECPEEVIAADFVLPGRVDSGRTTSQALAPDTWRRKGNTDSLPPLSRAETLNWIKQKECWIRRVLELQLWNDSWDGVIEAGAEGLEERATRGASRTVEDGPVAGSLTKTYRSGMKRLIAYQLLQNPTASDLAICRALDADGDLDLPKGWESKRQDRLFVEAYRDPERRNKVEVAISKVRGDLRKSGLLPER
jgi:hypothetical protein